MGTVMGTVRVELKPSKWRLIGSWRLSESWLGPAGAQRRVLLEGVPIFDPEYEFEIVSPSGELPFPNWIRFGLLEIVGSPDKAVQVLYCPELRPEGFPAIPTMLWIEVGLPSGFFESLWQIARTMPAQLKLGVSFDAKFNVSGHDLIWEIADVKNVGHRKIDGEEFWFEVVGEI